MTEAGGVVDLAGGQRHWPSEASQLWHGCLRRASVPASRWQVPVPQGDELLREQIGKRFGMKPECLTVTAGVRAAALTYARLAARSSKPVYVERPTFPGAVSVLRLGGARVEHLRWDELPAAPSDGTVWVTSPGRNPDGASLDGQLREQLTRRAARGQRVVVNGAYLWFDPLSPRVPHADHLGSFHKIAGHGCRLGWVFSASFFEEAVAELLGTTPSPVWQRAWGLFAAEGGLDLLAGHVVEHTRRASEVFHSEAGRYVSGSAPAGAAGAAGAAGEVSADGREPPAPHALLPLATGVDEGRALAALRSAGFALAPGEDFRCPAPAVRVSLLNASCDEALRFARFVSVSGLFRERTG